MRGNKQFVSNINRVKVDDIYVIKQTCVRTLRDVPKQ